MTHNAFRLSGPALGHDGSLTPFTQYVKFFGIDPTYTSDNSYSLMRLPDDSEFKAVEKAYVNYETGEMGFRPRIVKDETEADEPGDKDETDVNANAAVADQGDPGDEDSPIIGERLNVKAIHDDFAKCFQDIPFKFKLVNAVLVNEGTLPYKYRAIYLLEEQKALLHFTVHSSGHTNFDIYASDNETIKTILAITNQHSFKYRAIKGNDESFIHFICRNEQGYFTHQFEISDGIDFNDIFDNYEDNFKEDFSDIIIKKLSNMKYNKGIVLLYGAPGTGKTTYLRYILSKVKKKVMYLPPEMGHAISDPVFITFLMNNPNSILCIEDAENIIKTREAGGNQAVSNILNITDGILGSALKYQVICTFNAPLTEVDSALTRKGRMIGKYKFEALSPQKTRKLVNKLYGEMAIPEKDSMTLAEIHTMMDDMPTDVKPKTNGIGFVLS
jgi:hypothetical protein